MSRRVKIETRLFICGDDAEECVRHTFSGLWRTHGERNLLSHDEEENQGRTSILLDRDFVEIHRAGLFNSHMIFAEGKETQTKYHTPHGMIPMTVVTREIRRREFSDGGVLHIAYTLRAQGNHMTDNVLEIEWRTED